MKVALWLSGKSLRPGVKSVKLTRGSRCSTGTDGVVRDAEAKEVEALKREVAKMKEEEKLRDLQEQVDDLKRKVNRDLARPRCGGSI